MKKINFVLLLVGLLASSLVIAKPVTILGITSCGNWVKARSEKDTLELVYRAWLHGYLSGIAVESEKDLLDATDSESLALWVDKFCKANPLDNVGNAGYFLATELIKRKGN